MAAFEPELFDVRSDGLRDAQPVEGDEIDEGVVLWSAESGGDEPRADLVAIQAGGVRFVVEAGSAYVHRG